MNKKSDSTNLDWYEFVFNYLCMINDIELNPGISSIYFQRFQETKIQTIYGFTPYDVGISHFLRNAKNNFETSSRLYYYIHANLHDFRPAITNSDIFTYPEFFSFLAMRPKIFDLLEFYKNRSNYSLLEIYSCDALRCPISKYFQFLLDCRIISTRLHTIKFFDDVYTDLPLSIKTLISKFDERFIPRQPVEMSKLMSFLEFWRMEIEALETSAE